MANTMDRHDPKYVEDNAGFTTLPPDQHPGGKLPEGMTHVTTEEMGFLKALSWGDGTYRTKCNSCGADLVYEKHPADWPNHPGTPGELDENGDPTWVRVKIECNRCGAMQYTDGLDEKDFVEKRTAELRREIGDEIAKRLAAENGEPVRVESVSAHDTATGGDHAPGV